MAKKKTITIRSSAAEYLSYVASVGDQPLSVELRYEDENIWLTQRLMAELYGVTVPDISQHLKTIYSDGELTEGATIKKFLTVQQEGNRQVSRSIDHYNPQAPATLRFYATVQNKLHYAIHGHTAAELIVERADAGKVSAEMARIHAETEWEKYRIVQDRLYQSDFDRFLLLEEASAQYGNPAK